MLFLCTKTLAVWCGVYALRAALPFFGDRAATMLRKGCSVAPLPTWVSGPTWVGEERRSYRRYISRDKTTRTQFICTANPTFLSVWFNNAWVPPRTVAPAS